MVSPGTEAPYPDVQLFIAGTRRPGRGAGIPVINPATATEIGRCAVAEKPELDEALSAAAAGFRSWSVTSGYSRARVLYRAADLLRARSSSIAARIHLEQGKPFAEASGEVAYAADVLRWNAGEAERIYGRVIPPRLPGEHLTVLQEPIGPVLALTPWNFPIYQPVAKIAPALAAGCSVIVKPSEETPAGAAALIEALHDAGLPAGAVNMVFGNPAEISSYLIASPIIRKVSFTGSAAVGRIIASQAGQYLKKATLELGGHAPVIVCADADPEIVARQCAEQKFRNAGQVCVSASRFLVHRSIHPRFDDAFVAAARALAISPLISERRVSAVADLVDDALRAGAVLMTGGERGSRSGYHYPPTVLSEVPVEARIMREEPFGPVAAVRAFDSMDEALSIANGVPYGLAAYAFTNSSHLAQRLVTELEAGMVLINSFGTMYPETPFGGVKDSGFGSENGREGVEAYLRPKLAALSRAPWAQE